MKKFIMSNVKVVVAVIITAIVTGSIVYALSSSDVVYDNTNSNLEATTVQGAIDEIYEKAKNGGLGSGYKVTYDACGGSGAPLATSHVYGIKSNISSTKPTKTDYTFKGWSKTSCSGSVDYASGAEIALIKEGDTTTIPLYAIYQASGNENIVSASVADCYKTKTSGSCPAGTTITYKVNSSTTKTFSVLHDDGDKITMQDTTQTVSSTAWYASSNNNAYGPTTALSRLESATSGWSNVNDLNYTLGTDTLYQNKYTGCSDYNSCSTNTYTLAKRTAKARMITIQETSALGCTRSSCPSWLTPASGTYYWTMSANSSTSISAWYVLNYGRVGPDPTTATYGARAVVEINK